MSTTTLPTPDILDLAAQVVALKELGYVEVGEVKQELGVVEGERVVLYSQEMEPKQHEQPN